MQLSREEQTVAAIYFTGLSREASHDLSRFMIDGLTRMQRSLSRLSAEPAPGVPVLRPADPVDCRQAP